MFVKTDRLIRTLLVFLIAFAPLAFGSVEAWSRTVVIVTANLITLVWIARELIYPDASLRYWRTHTCRESPLPNGLFFPALAIFFLVALQLKTSLVPSQTALAGIVLVSLIGLFFAVLNTNLRFEDTRFLIAVLMTIGFALALAGILHKLSGRTDLLWIRPQPAGRNPFGPYVNKNHFAGLMLLIIPLGFGFLLAGGKDGKNRHRRVSQKTLLGFALIIMTGALAFTLSRGGMLGLTGALVVLGTLLSAVYPGENHRPVLLAVGVSALLFAFWLGGKPLIDRAATIFHLRDDTSFTSRLETWRDTVPIISDNPLQGTGLGTYRSVIDRYLRKPSPALWVHAHNDPLQLAAEFGLPGFAAVAALLYLGLSQTTRMVFRSRSRRIRYLTIGGISGILAFLVHSLGEFNFHITANAALFTVVSAVTMKTAFTVIRKSPGDGQDHSCQSG